MISASEASSSLLVVLSLLPHQAWPSEPHVIGLAWCLLMAAVPAPSRPTRPVTCGMLLTALTQTTSHETLQTVHMAGYCAISCPPCNGLPLGACCVVCVVCNVVCVVLSEAGLVYHLLLKKIVGSIGLLH